MRKLTALFLLLSLFVNPAFSQATPPASDPAISITGPASRAPGHSVYLKLKHTGNDLKVVCVPKNDEWTVLKQQDDSLTIHFNCETAGVYTFAVAVNLNNKTAVAVHNVEIKPATPNPKPPAPVPPSPTTALEKALQDAFDKDRPAGATIEQVKQLSANYAVAVTDLIPKAENERDLQTKMKAFNDSTITATALPSVRRAIADHVNATLSRVPTDPVDQTKTAAEWKLISDSLKKVS